LFPDELITAADTVMTLPRRSGAPNNHVKYYVKLCFCCFCSSILCLC